MRQPPLILVVDDDEDNRVALANRLSFHGYEVATACDGEEALAVAGQRRPDLVLLDVMMPGMDGFEVCRALRADPALPFFPIILVTARAASRDVVAGLEAGADEYLTKPVDPDALLARVRSMLRIKGLHDELSELNRPLDERVRRQVAELDRVGRLRRYFSPQVAELILAPGEEERLEKKDRREVTVVFCDLRGYTAFSNSAPEDVIGVLREYHAALGEVIFRHEGTLERFAGDGLMVFFNDPVECDNPRERAVRMAVEMRERMLGLTARWHHELDARLGFGVGIDHGYATTGRVGFEGRFDYAAIGPPTNRAARLCAVAADRQVLITQRVFAAIEPLVQAELIGDVELRGFSEPARVYNVLELSGPSTSSGAILSS
jgi:class 3 adenylate cyclase